MDQLPVFLNLAGRPVAVVGGGTIAARKAEMALRAGALVTVFAERLSDEFSELTSNPSFTFIARAATPDSMAGFLLVFAAAEDADSDAATAAAGRAAGVLVNVADTPEACDFTMPSIVDRSPLVIAISTAGASPILGRIIKARIEAWLPSAYGRLARFVGEWRDRVSARIKSPVERRRFWERMLDGAPADLILAGQDAKAADLVARQIEEAASAGGNTKLVGEVYLVGAGPGDPDLLTFRALQLMQRADVVVYDRLVGEPVLRLVRRDAERVYVGKLPQDHIVPQEEISRLLVRLARQGKRVLRLKGGDPFIFGRGGEEIETLAASAIPFQVVPGITAAAGCAAYAGIPLTHRDHAQACIFVTGHGKGGQIDLDWKVLLQPRQTIAIYMGLAHLGDLLAAFIAKGADPDLSAAVVDNGTRPNQRVVTGTLATLADKVTEAGLIGPSIIIIGSVVTLREKLAWKPDWPGVPAAAAAARERT